VLACALSASISGIFTVRGKACGWHRSCKCADMHSLAHSTPEPLLPMAQSPAARESRRTRFFEQASLLLPLAGIGVGAWLARDARTRELGVAALGGALGASLFRWQLARLFTEKARYEVEASYGAFEVRHYAARVQAETVINAAPWEQSLNDGFHRLAGYIFGKNAEHAKIAMTAPVTVTVGTADRAIRSVAFKMPDSRPIESLPEPDDRRITLRRISSRRVAVFAFSGRYGAALPERQRQALLAHVRAAGLIPIGDLTFAGYDAPSTLPFLRRNELMVEVSSLPENPSAVA
jgi:SOUL heme-binding protein